MSTILTDAFAKRQSGNYDIDFEIDQKEVDQLIQNTNEFINNIETYLRGLSLDAQNK